MRTYELFIDQMHSPEEVSVFLKENNVQKGDLLKVLTEKDENNLALKGLILIIIIAIIYSFTKHRQHQSQEGEKILADLFQGKSVEDIEIETEKEYGIKIEFEQREDKEKLFWQKVALKSVAKAYYTGEPDYSDVPLMEPNPKYNVWKKDQ